MTWGELQDLPVPSRGDVDPPRLVMLVGLLKPIAYSGW
jgi:hypothetical protein